MKLVGDRKNWTVGRISVLMLILFTLTDLILHVVDAQVQSLESPDYYDVLSAEVIRPAFRYHSSTAHAAVKPRLGLGSAAISSVTEALSPILPFTGGLDLRREDYWTNGWFGSVSSIIEQVRDAFSTSSHEHSRKSPFLSSPRGGSDIQELSQKSDQKSVTARPFAISDPNPFVPLKDIADMTLKDMTMAFRYAVESTREDYNGPKFLQSVAPKLRGVFQKISDVAARSRGNDVAVPTTTGLLPTATETGDIDALHFCAAMRIFAEWRLLRLVPDGYKGYAVGMSLGHKDVVQNVAKMEQTIYDMIDMRKDQLTASDGSNDGEITKLESPTLRELLQFELDMGVHPLRPKLKDKSGSMGLLWVRRQLQYQTQLFSNVLQVPKKFSSTQDAVSAAYSEVYDKYHGWAVQKIFNYSFQAAPEAKEIYKFMNPQRLREVTESAKTHALGGEDDDSLHEECGMINKELNPIEKLGMHIGNEWNKFAGPVVQLFGMHAPKSEMNCVRGGSTEPIVELQADIDDYISREMAKDAREHILSYLEVAQPLLEDLAGLFDELNMDDPTKV